MSISKLHTGIIDDYLYSPHGQITGYRIIENNEVYFAHLGDVETTENLLYDLRDHKTRKSLDLEVFEKGQNVKFQVFGEINPDAKHAIHMKNNSL